MALIAMISPIFAEEWNTVDGNALSDRVFPGPLLEKKDIAFQNDFVLIAIIEEMYNVSLEA